MKRAMAVTSAMSILGGGCASVDVDQRESFEHVRPVPMDQLPAELEAPHELRVVERDGTRHIYPRGTQLLRLDDGLALTRTDGEVITYAPDALARIEVVSIEKGPRRRHNDGVATGVVIGLVALTAIGLAAAAMDDGLDGVGNGLGDLGGFAIGL